MGYQVWPDGEKGWTLRCVIDRGDHRERRAVKKDSPEFKELGFNRGMTREQARARVKQIQSQDELKREYERQAKIAARTKRIKLIESASLPPELVSDYEATLLQDENIRIEHWQAAQKLIAKIPVTPEHWFFRKAFIYNLFVEMKYSPDYSNRMIRVLNSWGYFYGVKLNKAWRGLPRVKGQVLKNILRAYHSKKSVGTLAATPELLATLKDLTPELYSWCFITFWFGLRPRESDMLTSTSLMWRIDHSDKRFPVLYVCQSKLLEEGVSENRAWKAIPAVESQQLKAIEIIKSGKFRRPSPQWFKKHCEGRTARSFRKGFNIYMRSLGYLKEDRQKWMGHQSGDMIDAHYEDNLQVSFHPKKTG